MNKKMLSGLLTLVMVFSNTMGVFAANKTNKDESLTSSKAAIVSTENLEELAKQTLTTDEKEKIKNDYNSLSKVSVALDSIYDIEAVKNGKNVYKIEYPNNIKEDITIEYKDGEYIMDVSQGKVISNNLIFKCKDVYIDGYKVHQEDVVVSKEDVVVPKQDVSALDDIIQSRGDFYNTSYAPYDSAGYYNDYDHTESTTSVYYGQAFRWLSMTAVIAFINYYAKFKGVGQYVASALVAAFPNSNSEGMSFKNQVYYHRDGHYIPAMSAYVNENYVTWYENTNYYGYYSYTGLIFLFGQIWSIRI